MSKSAGRGIQSVEVGNRLLLSLMRSGSPMMLRDLAQEARISAAQAHAYLTSLRRTELVEQEPASGRYILGPATNRLASARMETFDPMSDINARAPDFAHSLGVMLALLVWGPAAPTVYRVHDASQIVNTNLRPGTTFNILNSAAGRIFGAFDTSPAVKERLASELASASGDGERLVYESAIARIRTSGYAMMVESPVPGLASIAVPVLRDGECILVAMIIGPRAALDVQGAGSPAEALLAFTRTA
ncbi:helix-turn-helix domain-containing protein [Sphingobium sp. AN558]|uniref:IclR family transcriptional regulator n=1 Tax=Sphingobium sp. AN558 TaxID=3133442 RepID=UPI0030C33E2E